MAFAPGRADHDRYLVWNGPFGRGRENEQPPAPRQSKSHPLATFCYYAFGGSQ